MNKTYMYNFMYEEGVTIEALAGQVLERGQNCNGLKSPTVQAK